MCKIDHGNGVQSHKWRDRILVTCKGCRRHSISIFDADAGSRIENIVSIEKHYNQSHLMNGGRR